MTQEELNQDLFQACLREDRRKVLKCINEGAEVNAKNVYGITPLHWAAEKGKILVAKVLFKAGAIINAQDNQGNTPLHYAAATGKLKMMKELIKVGAKPNICNNDGHTPYVLAGRHGNYKIAYILLKEEALRGLDETINALKSMDKDAIILEAA